MVQAWTVGLLLYLSNDSEKWNLKLGVYKTPFGKSGHISRLTVVSREAKEEAASSALTDSRLTHVSIIQEQELWKSKMP